MKPFNNDGKELDAIFNVSHAENSRIYLTLESRGGGKSGPRPPRNADYAEALELLLFRLGRLNATLENIEVFSGPAQKWPSKDRRITALSITLPVNIRDILDVRDFRLQLGRAGSALGQAKASSGGSTKKRLRFLLKWDEAQTKSENKLELILANRDLSPGAKVESDLPKYEKIGAQLRSSTNSEIRFRLSEIEKIVETTLPEEARTAQFWANTSTHHPSHRDQWLDAGYNAFYEKRTETVRFSKAAASPLAEFEISLEPTDRPDELQRRVAAAKNKMLKPNGSLIDPPVGTSEVKTVEAKVIRHVRDPKVVAWVLAKAAGSCELCLAPAPFQGYKDEPFLEVHHIRPLAEGGPDKTENAAALCPNCHRLLHYAKDRVSVRSILISKIDRLIDYPAKVVSPDA